MRTLAACIATAAACIALTATTGFASRLDQHPSLKPGDTATVRALNVRYNVFGRPTQLVCGEHVLPGAYEVYFLPSSILVAKVGTGAKTKTVFQVKRQYP